MNVSPPPSLWECGNPAPFAGFPSAVETVEKSLLFWTFPRFPWRVISTASLWLYAPPLLRRFFAHKFRRGAKKLGTDAGMSMKTKDRCGKSGGKAGMFMKTKVVMCSKREYI